ncbi:MAG: hypothetical protein V4581_04860 [Bacteroidota bacterium]
MALLMLIFFSIISAIAGGLLYILAWIPIRTWLKKKERLSPTQDKRFNIIYIGVFIAIPACIGYRAAFPGDDFFASEFKDVTLRDLPDSAKIVDSEATYPDFHGDYQSKSTIKLSSSDFNRLKNELMADSRISKPGENKYPDEFIYIPRQAIHKDAEMYFFRQEPGESDWHLTIEFSRDGKTVYVYVVVT